MPPPEQLYGSVPPAKEEVLFKCLNLNFDYKFKFFNFNFVFIIIENLKRYKRLQPTANSESE